MTIDIPVMEILKTMATHAVLPFVINIAIFSIAISSGAARYVLRGTYDELLWLFLLPLSWFGTICMALLTIIGAYEGVKYNYFGGRKEEERRETARIQEIRNQQIKREEEQIKYEKEMKPHIEKFNKELLKVATYLSKSKRRKKK